MFNRELRVKMVKSNKKNEETVNPTDTPFESKVEIVDNVIKGVFVKIGGVIVLYVSLDTARKILVAAASK